MADLLPPWTIDSPDNLKASLDDLTLTLDSPLCDTSVTRWDAYASVSVTATATADGIRVQFGSGAVDANASVSAEAIRVQFGAGDIQAAATVVAEAIRVQFGTGVIEAVPRLLQTQYESNTDKPMSQDKQQ